MYNLNNDPELISKEIILKYVQDIDVYRLYIDFDIVIGGKPVMSPLREEKEPSFGFFLGDSKEVCFKDFRLGGGDFVRFTQLMFGLNYFDALSKIAVDLKIDGNYICRGRSNSNSVIDKKKSIIERSEIIRSSDQLALGKRSRKWIEDDKIFWLSYGIGLSTLKKFRVEPVDYIFVNGQPIKTDLLAYCFTETKDGKETYKIYQPLNPKFKWINNHDNSVWQGWEQLPSTGTDLIITKSLKDVMALDSVCGLPAVALQSENVVPKKHVFLQLQERFEDVTVLYDNDFNSEINWGKKFGDKLAREYGLMDCYIHERWECKDFSDLVKKYGKEEAKDILLRQTLIPF